MPDIVSNALAKLPPQNIEAEQSLIGSLLIDKDAIIKVADLLSPHDFYRDVHGILYATILELFEKREAIDILSLISRLEEKKRLEDNQPWNQVTTPVAASPER